MLDALRQTFADSPVDELIPKIIKKALGILRRQANAIRKEIGEEVLEDI